MLSKDEKGGTFTDQLQSQINLLSVIKIYSSLQFRFLNYNERLILLFILFTDKIYKYYKFPKLIDFLNCTHYHSNISHSRILVTWFSLEKLHKQCFLASESLMFVQQSSASEASSTGVRMTDLERREKQKKRRLRQMPDNDTWCH